MLGVSHRRLAAGLQGRKRRCGAAALCDDVTVPSLPELLERVDVAFERTSEGLRAWPDPHPDRSASDDEYSRVTDPAKWRIVGARADAWVDALVGAGLASIPTDPAVDWAEPPGTAITRTTFVTPYAPDALPLVVARSRIESVDDAGVTLGVGAPAALLVWVPDCGCDACDSGSQDALDELDEYIAAVVSGEFRRLRRGDRSVTLLGHRRQATNLDRHGVAAVLADPAGWHELSGTSWFADR